MIYNGNIQNHFLKGYNLQDNDSKAPEAILFGSKQECALKRIPDG